MALDGVDAPWVIGLMVAGGGYFGWMPGQRFVSADAPD